MDGSFQASELIKKYLNDLRSLVSPEAFDSGTDTNVENPLSTIQNIEYLTDVAISSESDDGGDLEGMLFALFDSSAGFSLLNFLEDTVKTNDKEIKESKVHALKFIAKTIKILSIPSYWGPYAVNICTTLMNLFDREEKERTSLLLPLKNMLRLSISTAQSSTEAAALVSIGTAEASTTIGGIGGTDNKFSLSSIMTAEAIDIDAAYNILLREIKNSKNNKTCIGEILKTLGLLVAAFPHHPNTRSNAPTILDHCNRALKKNFPSKDPQMPIIAGAFSCLDRLLVHYTNDAQSNRDLFGDLLQCIASITQVNRYGMASKALRLLRNHALLFQAHIGAHIRVYDLLLQCCNASQVF